MSHLPQALHSRLKAYQRKCPTTHDIMACVLHRSGLGVVTHPAPNALDIVLPIEHGSKMAIATDARRQRRFTERDVRRDKRDERPSADVGVQSQI